MIRRGLIVGFAVLCCALVPRAAWPCGVLPTCEPVVVVPVGNAPANVPEVFLQYGRSCTSPFSETTADDAILETGNGVPVPFTRIENRLVPAAPFVEGTRYQVRFTETCPADGICPWDDDPANPGGSTDGPPREITVAFDAQAPAPPPSTLGTVRIASQTTEVLDVWATTGRCTEDILANVVILAIEPSDELAPWFPLTQFTVWVDGVIHGTTDFGSTGTAFLGEATSWNGGAGGPRLLWTLCQDTVTYDGIVMTPGVHFDAGLPPGMHQVRVEAYVASHDLTLSEELEIELGCTKAFDRGENPTGPIKGARGCGTTSGDGSVALPFLLGLVLFARRARYRRCGGTSGEAGWSSRSCR